VIQFRMHSKRITILLGLSLAPILLAHATNWQVAEHEPLGGESADGTVQHPFATISQAAAKAAPGDTVTIRDGIYREQITVKQSGSPEAPIIFTTSPGAHVVVTGADAITGWQKVPGETPIYRVPWTHKFIGWTKNMTHPDDEYHRLIGRCEQVAIDGYLFRQVLAVDQLAPGAFFADTENQALEVWDSGYQDLNKVLVEASVRAELFHVDGDYVAVRGLNFRFAANMAQHGAVVLEGNHDTLEDCTFESMNSSGATITGTNQVIRHCIFRDNGQLGFGANGAHNLLLTECRVENNNTKNFSRGWEAGGDKLVLCRDAVIERSQFLRNRGTGIWFDIGNENCTVRQCLIADNEDAGIFDEISYGLQAHDNVIVGNGFAPTGGAWGAQAGITLSSSPESVIEKNLIFGNREGFNFREQNRTTVRIGGKVEEPIWNHDQTIRRNIIADNRDAQIWGWFDMKDGRQWPAKGFGQPSPPADNSAKPGDIAGDYLATNSAGQPVNLTLERLRLNFAENIYYADAGQGWFEWGVSWGQHKSYAQLNGFQTDLGIDHGSRVAPLVFANPEALDFRLEAGAMAAVKQNYPAGPVPGVLLGAQR